MGGVWERRREFDFPPCALLRDTNVNSDSSYYMTVLAKRPALFCINDDFSLFSRALFDAQLERLHSFLHEYFGTNSSSPSSSSRDPVDGDPESGINFDFSPGGGSGASVVELGVIKGRRGSFEKTSLSNYTEEVEPAADALVGDGVGVVPTTPGHPRRLEKNEGMSSLEYSQKVTGSSRGNATSSSGSRPAPP